MPARKRLHRSITTDLLNTAPPVELGEQPVAILLAGPPGSGKSSARRALFEASDDQITGGLNPSDFVTIDADTIKEQLLNQAQQDGSLQNFLIPPEARHLQNQGETFCNLDDTSKPRQTIQQLLETNPPKIDTYRRFDAQTVGQPPVLTQRGHRIDDHIQINSTTPKPNTQHHFKPPTQHPNLKPSQRLGLKPSQRQSKFAGRETGHDSMEL